MSSKAKRMAEQVSMPEQNTKKVTYRIDVTKDDEPMSCYMIISGVPEDLPEEYMGTVKATAQNQFAQVLKMGGFLELYPRGKDASTSTPTFYNLNMCKTISIDNIEEVK